MSSAVTTAQTQYALRTTNELSTGEKQRLCSLFQSVFNRTLTYSQFQRKFEATPTGFSYHGLMLSDDAIVGCYSVIPSQYSVGDRDYLFGLSVDTMIDEKHRGNPFNLKRMATLAYQQLKADGIPFVFGFPNDNVYLVRKKVLNWEDIGELRYYVLPLNIGALKPSLKLFNGASRLLAKAIMAAPYRRSHAPKSFLIRKKNSQAYCAHRYDETYRFVGQSPDSSFVYKIYEEGRAVIAYLIDVEPLTPNGIEAAVKYIYDHERRGIDAIMYVGALSFAPHGLLRVPKRYEPKVLHMSGKLLIDGALDKEQLFDIANWAVNLSNYDVR